MNEEPDFDEDYDYDPDSAYHDCPKCGRSYDELDYEFQVCRACGWDAEKEKFDKPRRPTQSDYLSGDADILTGRWW